MFERVRENTKFKIGDKVYICTGESRLYPEEYCIRATIIGTEHNSYLLKAFKQDCPGIWMSNIYDEDLILRMTKDRLLNYYHPRCIRNKK